jgi:hypothetical protein
MSPNLVCTTLPVRVLVDDAVEVDGLEVDGVEVADDDGVGVAVALGVEESPWEVVADESLRLVVVCADALTVCPVP